MLKYEDLTAVSSVPVSKSKSNDWYIRYGKRTFDIAFGLLLLPLITPVIAVLWLLAQKDGRLGFFGHERIGQDGVPFTCWKIRSMVHDADERLSALLASDPAARAEWDSDQKLTDDPRVTAFGRFIRRTSLDELPQIINVLKGEMSFVGPRPVVRDELQRYGPCQSAYLANRPGITGLWQTSGRNDLSYSDRVRYDVRYDRDVCFMMDVKLILRTAHSVAFSTGK